MADDNSKVTGKDKRFHHGDNSACCSDSTADKQKECTCRTGGCSRKGDSEHQHSHETGSEVTFSGFMLSLGASALIAMGVDVDGTGQQAEPRKDADFVQAADTISLIAMIEEKTKGNLAPEEVKVLQDILYTLRMKYMEQVNK